MSFKFNMTSCDTSAVTVLNPENDMEFIVSIHYMYINVTWIKVVYLLYKCGQFLEYLLSYDVSNIYCQIRSSQISHGITDDGSCDGTVASDGHTKFPESYPVILNLLIYIYRTYKGLSSDTK